VRIARVTLTDEALELLFDGAVLRFIAEDLEVQIDLDVDMKGAIEKAMLALLPTSPTVN